MQIGKSYTLEEILAEISAGFDPYLMVQDNNIWYHVRIGHMTVEQVLQVPGLKSTIWLFKQKTNNTVLFTTNLPAHCYFDVPDYIHITPKGYPVPWSSKLGCP